jgi:RNA polymerase sigma-70 factor (ECF subfamily)
MTEIGTGAASFRSLLDRLRRGEEDAARELIDRYGDAVRREIRFWLRDSQLSRVVDESDVFQSAVSQFLWGLRLGKFDVGSPGELLRLLRTIAQRGVCGAARFWRAQRRDLRRNADLDGLPEAMCAAADPTPSKVASAKELIAETLARLPEPARRIVRWRQEGLGWAQIAELLNGGATPEAVRKQFERSVARVAAELGLEDSD